uniref:Thioredoxin n=1 Tax=Antithamnion hubbsii TaxID=1005974 RepID=A0A4D6WPK9_9FLOR|nr:Thioredoxin [Antithamnion hubbsii]
MGISCVTDSSFNKDVLQSNSPVLVDFWAPWCGPCRMIAPVISEIADEYEDRLKVVTINTDENPTTATYYGIRSIPTIMMFIKGKKVSSFVGAVPKSTLLSALIEYIEYIEN